MTNTANRATLADIQVCLEPIIAREGLRDVSIDLAGTSAKGDNFMGDITFIKLSGTITDTSEKKSFDLVVKTSKKSAQLRELMPIHECFENEIVFYKDLLPEYRKLQSEKGVEPFKNAPKCEGVLELDDSESLVLRNLKTEGYVLYDKTKPMTLDHIKRVVEIYGKYHAISHALRDQKPEIFKGLDEKLVDIFLKMNEKMNSSENKNRPSAFKDIIQIAKDRNETQIVEKIEQFEKELVSTYGKKKPTDPYAIIVHGDCWNNNFMFKYADEQQLKIEKVCLLDFQLCRLASPIVDLSYFLFCCLAPEDTDKFIEINNVYYESLSRNVKLLGSDPDKVFPFEELWNQWRKYGQFGLAMMPALLKICLSEKDETKDLAEIVESGQDLSDSFINYEVKNIEEYGRRCLAILQLAIDQEII